MALPMSLGSFWPRFFFRASPTSPKVGRSEVFLLISARSAWFGMMSAIAVPADTQLGEDEMLLDVFKKGVLAQLCGHSDTYEIHKKI